MTPPNDQQDNQRDKIDGSSSSESSSGEETFQDLMNRSTTRRTRSRGSERPRPPASAPIVAKPPPKKSRVVGRPSTVPVPDDDPGDEFMRAGLQHREMQRLKQGKFHLGENQRLDLHGLKRGEAHDELIAFLENCIIRDARYALVICGKGLHSPTGQPVLKSAIHGYLAQHPKVLAYCPAQLRDGGDGALYVLLKAKHKAKHGTGRGAH